MATLTATMSDEHLQDLRHLLHRHAETAFEEEDTAQILREELDRIGVHVVADDVAGHGILVRLDPDADGPRLLLRTDMDALPLKEETGADYASSDKHHACGHDGHMTMLLGAIAELADDPRCDVWALFQPAEETGEGMAKCLEHEAFPDDLDHVIAFHNVPGHPMGTVLVREGSAAVASTGIILRLTGATSHAAEPDAGRNPIRAAAALVPIIEDLAKKGDDDAVAAIVHIQGGGPRFGTSAGDCLLAATLRAGTDGSLRDMVDHLVSQAEKAAAADGLDLEVEEVEPFPATTNDDAVVAAVKAAAKAIGADTEDPGIFPWSEDFGHATDRWPGALVGLGSGEDLPALHSPTYDFPDDLIPHGVRLWTAIVEELA